ncbi:MAG: sugar ABC transporter permease [Oscillospiraceae bacterium]|nr:sugar ABC transporter permease [Oscillospiraceae bacterium]
MMDNKSIRAALKKNAMLIILLLVYLFFLVLTKGSIFNPSSFTELINQNAYVYILGVGMLMCMLTGGNIDLSCGAFVCLLGAFGGVFMIVRGMEPGVSILLMLLIGIAYGIFLGFLIAYVHIPPWIATLAGYLAFRGLGTSILSSNSKTGSLAPFPVSFQNIFYGRIFPTEKGVFNVPCLVFGMLAAAAVVLIIFLSRRSRLAKGYEADSVRNATVKSVLSAAVIILVMTKLSLDGGIPTTLLWVAGIVLIYSFITSKTTVGRHFYIVGGNMETARLSGVNTRRIMFLAYLNMAVLTAIATFTVIARSQSAYADVGKNFEMDAISACVVGGVSASGGAGSVFGMVVGATLIGIINLGMSLISLDANYQRVVKGFVLLAAVVFDILSKKRDT